RGDLDLRDGPHDGLFQLPRLIRPQLGRYVDFPHPLRPHHLVDPAVRAVEDQEDAALAIEGAQGGTRGVARDGVPSRFGIEGEELAREIDGLSGILSLMELLGQVRDAEPGSEEDTREYEGGHG